MTRSVSSLLGVWLGFLAALCCVAVSLVARAEAPPDPAGAASAEPSGPPPEWQPGPRTVNLGHDVKVELPAGYMYLPPAEAKKALEWAAASTTTPCSACSRA